MASKVSADLPVQAPYRRGDASAPTSSAGAKLDGQPTLTDYLRVTLFLTAFSCLLAWLTARGRGLAAEPAQLLGPMLALFALTAVVWLLMVVVRNANLLRGLVSAKYFVDYRTHPPAEWTERPAATFNNLMQVPPLFYVVCLLMMQTGQLDRAQIWIAWVFPAARLLHAIAYIGWNRLPSRFASWVAGCITLGVLWARFAMLAWPY